MEIDEQKMAKIRREQKRRLQGWRMEDEKYRGLDKEVKKSCRTDKRMWLERRTTEKEKNNSKTLYRMVRELTSSRSSSSVPIRGKDDRTLLRDEEWEARRAEHLREVLNQPTPPTLFSHGQEPPAPTLSVTSDEISRTEVARAIKSLKNNKEMTSNLQEHREKVGLWISHKKTKATIIGQDQDHPPLTIDKHDIEYVKNFTYVGSNI